MTVRQRVSIRNMIICILILSLFNNLILGIIESGRLLMINCDISLSQDKIREMHIDVSTDQILEKAEEMDVSAGELITVLMALHDDAICADDLDSLSKTEYIRLRNRLVRLHAEDFSEISKVYNGLIADMETFPVPKSNYETIWVEFTDSWGSERTYGGERRHEGTDIMAQENKAGVYPIVSICDGTITNMGWLELGGYRIGITSDNGIYYYYAHMASYADVKEGDRVTAGQFLGFMGDTGYSQVEGTTGKFDVHLHFGIYLTDTEGNEIAVNPYYLLKYLQNKVLYYNYSL